MQPLREIIEQSHLKIRQTAGLVSRPPAPVLACSVCDGIQFISMGDFEIGDPRFGKTKPCPKCNPRHIQHADRFGMLASDYDLEWDCLLDLPDSNAQAIARQVREVVERGYGGVYLHGGYGMAKTAILKIAAAEWLRSGRHGAYLLFSDLLDEIRAGFDKDTSASAYERLREWSSYPFLAIDELDKARATEFMQETQFRLLDRRYERVTRAGETVTLIASNEPPDSLPPALRSRLSDPRFMTVLELTGRDARPIADKFDLWRQDE